MKSINEITAWNKLKVVQKNHVISTSYMWFVLVPIVAKLFSKIEDTLKITINGKDYIFDLVLPFSWQIFFFSALSFIIGNLIYLFYSPKIVNEFNDFGEYKIAGKTYLQLESYMTDEMKEKHEEMLNLKRLMNNGLNTKASEEDMKLQFWNIFTEYNYSLRTTRYCVGIFYIIGFALFTYVATTNIYWVIKQIIL